MGPRAKPARRRGAAGVRLRGPHKPKDIVLPAELLGSSGLRAVESILNGEWGADVAREATAIVLDAQKPNRIHIAAERFNGLASTVPIKLSLAALRMPGGGMLRTHLNVGGSED